MAERTGDYALDIAERQVLVLFAADALPWHHRILVERLDRGRWIGITPTHDIEVVDLGEREDVRPLERASPLPESCRPVFSFEGMDASEMRRLRWRCRCYADVIGFTTPADPSPSDSEWYFADTGADNFGEVVPAPLLDADRAVLRGACALAQRYLDDPSSFTFVQRVWKGRPGRDPRLNEGDPADTDRPRLSDSLSTMRQDDKKYWMFKGPSAAREILDGTLSPGMEPPSYFVHYVGAGGLTPNSAWAAELQHLLTVLWKMVSHDRLDVYSVGASEYVARQKLMIQRAVKRNTRSPVSSGLESFLANLIDSSGGLVTRELERYVADVQRGQAQILKQQRLAREEAKGLEKRTKVGKGEKGGGRAAADGSS